MANRVNRHKTVLVTGGSSGIGAAVVKQLLHDDYVVTVVARGKTESELDGIRCVSERLSVIGADLTDGDAIAAIGRSIKVPLYAVVNNAGVWLEDWIDQPDYGQMDAQWRLNVNAPYYLVRAVHRNLQSGGRVVNMASQLALVGRPGMAAYVATKHALLGLTRAWALELAPRRIAVNAVCPGWVDTSSNARDFERTAKVGAQSASALRRQITRTIPMKRFIQPQEVAGLISFLLSPLARSITGEHFCIR
jgi:NAD(P)-dependent dehydrogenase (short-subunit alcohol dehydrogenase family)